MQFSAKQISEIINGDIVGSENNVVSRFDKIEEATKSSLCFFANEKYASYIAHCPASVLLVSKEFDYPCPDTMTLIKVDNPYQALAVLLDLYQKGEQKVGVEQPSYIAPSAKTGASIYRGAFSYIGEHTIIGENVKIYPNVTIGDKVIIGDNTIIYSGASIYSDCQIGNNCIIHSGVVIGSDGFGFVPNEKGEFNKIPQVGNVIVEDRVEVGANTVIDRATMGSTVIKSGTKLDNLIQIAHNVTIGKHTVISAQTGISGSTKVGNHVMIGGQAGIVGHIEIADHSKINAQSGVSKSLKSPHSAVTGSPAWDYTSMLRAQAVFKKLPELLERVKQLELELNENKKNK
jgi:UDP-3-O-[3-hydroxymyristoyl] glucosamine N-acyltransferase